MDWLIWVGAALTMLGVIGLLWCILAVASARRAGLDDRAMKQRLQQLAAYNFAALGLSAIGLMAVILGITLG